MDKYELALKIYEATFARVNFYNLKDPSSQSKFEIEQVKKAAKWAAETFNIIYENLNSPSAEEHS